MGPEATCETDCRVWTGTKHPADKQQLLSSFDSGVLYLQLHVNTHVLPGARVIEQVEDCGDQRLVDAAQLAVDDALQDGAEPSPLGHHLWVLQGCGDGKEENKAWQKIW